MTVDEHTTTAAAEPMLCDELRAASEDIWQAAFHHPFLLEIENNTLPDEKLLYYFIQNVHYIDAAARFSAQAVAKAPDAKSRGFALRLLDFGRGEVERQREYITRLEESVSTPVSHEVAPSALGYINHLLSLAAYGGALDLFVGLLPCEWTYSEFGTRLLPIVQHPVHKDWLATFGGADHKDMNDVYRDIIQHLGHDASPARKRELAGIFRISSRYEWMFWETAYTLEKWPI